MQKYKNKKITCLRIFASTMRLIGRALRAISRARIATKSSLVTGNEILLFFRSSSVNQSGNVSVSANERRLNALSSSSTIFQKTKTKTKQKTNYEQINLKWN